MRLPQACELEDLEKRLELMRDESVKVGAELEEAHRLIGESQQKVGEVAEAKAWLAEHRSELLKVESERKLQESLRAELVVQQEKLKGLTVELSRLGHELAKERTNVTHISTEKANLAGEVDSLKRQLAEITKQIADKTLALNAIVNDINLKNVDLVRLNEQLETTNKYLEKAKQTFDALMASVDGAKRAFADTEIQKFALEQECGRLKAEIADLQKWKETLTALLKQLQANVDRLDPQVTGVNRYKDLWEPCKFAPLPLARARQDENSALERTERYLRALGLHYPRRVLHAFHAALKTADMSPLVVLAGISGTGKSLLPKRYAEAMGMHMVTLAVQPRWDSPQDLFGFFNHLEGRYKATELARAMVQFERYNRQGWAMPKDWDYGREDRMLLVLLDEMNLARVEYYFSEFLSKLETRRDVNEQDAFDRAKAEISLDMGSLREDERNIRLYPGKNILFSGTMNEDESTQSLSDKVIDRACVMRFGRPNRMDGLGQPESDVTPEKDGLGFDNWSKWCDNALSASDERTVNKWIKALNDGMDMLGKPFAHRVHQAILSYVGHYPRTSGQDHLRLAIADQIEQRILPKLRGVELEGNEEAMEAIKKVVIESGDSPLSGAFEKAMDVRTGTFLWRGLDRTDA